jgi:hypothetical protein
MRWKSLSCTEVQNIKEDPSKCWAVWPSGDPDEYRLFNVEMAEEAVHGWVHKYCHDDGIVNVSMHRDDLAPLMMDVTQFLVKGKAIRKF